MRVRSFYLISSLLVALLMGISACASSPAGPQIRVENAWARPAQTMQMESMSNTPGKATGAVYLVLINKGGTSDRLVGISTDVAESAEIHQTRIKDDVMRMVPVMGGLEIPAKGQVALNPGGYHIMLIGLKRDLKPGDRFTIVLRFEKSGDIAVEVEVKQP